MVLSMTQRRERGGKSDSERPRAPVSRDSKCTQRESTRTSRSPHGKEDVEARSLLREFILMRHIGAVRCASPRPVDSDRFRLAFPAFFDRAVRSAASSARSACTNCHSLHWATDNRERQHALRESCNLGAASKPRCQLTPLLIVGVPPGRPTWHAQCYEASVLRDSGPLALSDRDRISRERPPRRRGERCNRVSRQGGLVGCRRRPALAGARMEQTGRAGRQVEARRVPHAWVSHTRGLVFPRATES